MAMADEIEDLSVVLSFEASGIHLISEIIAAKYVDMLISDHFGKTALDGQRPLVVIDEGDRWAVEGNSSLKAIGETVWRVVVLKSNGRVVEFLRRPIVR